MQEMRGERREDQIQQDIKEGDNATDARNERRETGRRMRYQYYFVCLFC